MSLAETAGPRTAVIEGLLDHVREANSAAGGVLARARASLGRLPTELFDAEQHDLHALAWLATYAEVLRVLAEYAERLARENRLALHPDRVHDAIAGVCR